MSTGIFLNHDQPCSHVTIAPKEAWFLVWCCATWMVGTSVEGLQRDKWLAVKEDSGIVKSQRLFVVRSPSLSWKKWVLSLSLLQKHRFDCPPKLLGVAFCLTLTHHFPPKNLNLTLWQRCLPWGMLGKSKSLNDDTGMVVADGHLEEDRELIALEQYMGDAWEQRLQVGMFSLWWPRCSYIVLHIYTYTHIQASWFKAPVSLTSTRSRVQKYQMFCLLWR